MEARREAFKKVLQEINNGLQKGQDLVGCQLIEDFIIAAKGDIDKIDEISKQDRELKIGIVGEVKAGKSSFLNALIFDGDNYLPKAATPMTAALTKLGYSEKSYAIINFYSSEDWEGVLAESNKLKRIVNERLNELKKEYDKRQLSDAQGVIILPEPTFESVTQRCKSENKITQVMIDCYNLEKMKNESTIFLDDWFGKTERIEGNVVTRLFDYIGADGKYASIVKYAEIYLDNPLLKGIEIIDTPGLNDPISSRSRKTKEFIVECDVVFLLSYLGQFMSAEDIGFLNKEIGAANIKEAFIIGSKLDSGILDYNGIQGCTIFDAYQASKNNYMEQGYKVIKEQASMPYSADVFKVLNQKSLEGQEVIYLVSSVMFGAAKALIKGKRYSAEEENIIKRMKRRFTGFREDSDFMLALAGIDKLKIAVLDATRTRKDEIIEKRIKEFIDVRTSMYLKKLEIINEDLSHRLELLENSDAQELKNKIIMISKNLERSRKKIRAIFEKAETGLTNHMKGVGIKIKNEVDEFVALQSSTEIQHKYVTVRSGLFGCWKKTIREDVRVPVANVSDATSNIMKFIATCDKVILDESRKIFKVTEIKKELKEAVFGVFDASDDKFNEDDILIPVESTLGKMQEIDIRVSVKNFAEELESKFPNANVQGATEVAKLELSLTKALIEATEEYTENLQERTNEAQLQISNYSTSFIDEIKEKAIGNLETIQKQLADKEAFIEKNIRFTDYIIQAKEDLRKI